GHLRVRETSSDEIQYLPLPHGQRGGDAHPTINRCKIRCEHLRSLGLAVGEGAIRASEQEGSAYPRRRLERHFHLMFDAIGVEDLRVDPRVQERSARDDVLRPGDPCSSWSQPPTYRQLGFVFPEPFVGGLLTGNLASPPEQIDATVRLVELVEAEIAAGDQVPEQVDRAISELRRGEASLEFAEGSDDGVEGVLHRSRI